jgi:signal transduction histidine kinase
MLNFVLLVAGILLTFSVIIVMFYFSYRNEDFSIRLKNKAINTATLLFSIQGINTQMLRIIDDKTVIQMNDVTVIILNYNREVLYTNRDSREISELLPAFVKLNWQEDNKRVEDNKLYISFQRTYNNQKYYVLASAIDLFGESELRKLLLITVIAFVISIFLIILAGYYNARQSVKPIKSIIRQIDEMSPGNLSTRLVINTKDEIAELSATFNEMLDRIERAFESERMFVSNVSHELRTPVTSIIGQIEVALLKQRTEEDYKQLAHSLLDDVKNLKTIINGFLILAESGIDNIPHDFQRLRIDELLFSVKDEILKYNTQYQISIEFDNPPDDEKELIISGDERLLRMLLINLIDNSCKFSDPPRLIIKIAYDKPFVSLYFIDHGMGIPEADVKHVYEPLYRATNASGKQGHGIGLSIVKRIAEIHKAQIEIKSELNIGTTISVSFPFIIKN